MKNLSGAMEEEARYIEDRLNNINTSLLSRLSNYGYNNLMEYFDDKRNFLFHQWIPEVTYIDVATLTTELEKAIKEKRYGIYISISNGLYAFHGTDEIDYELCDSLGVCVAELYHQGGTIIGSNADLGIEIIAPMSIGLDNNYILNKFYEIISKYVDNITIDGNDLLVNGEKVMGSMRRNVGDVFVWAAQVSFNDYSDIIAQICSKKSIKKPSYIDNKKLSKNQLEKEVLEWLQKN
jgi:hypothetical protein